MRGIEIAGGLRKDIPPLAIKRLRVRGTLPARGNGVTTLGTSPREACDAYWPNPRFTVNGDGTVTDNMTGLVWLEDANCNGTMSWATALSWANGLFDGSISSGGVNQDCGLSDGSLPGEWRVPTEAEFESLACMEYDNPAIPNTEGTGQWVSGDPFIDIQSGSVEYYWTSTSVETGPASAYLGFPRSQATTPTGKSYAGYVWPVRDSR
jgi:hypothetical protein